MCISHGKRQNQPVKEWKGKILVGGTYRVFHRVRKNFEHKINLQTRYNGFHKTGHAQNNKSVPYSANLIIKTGVE